VVALADAGRLALPTALAIVDGGMLVIALLGVAIASRVPPSAPDAPDAARVAVGMPLEHR
jgi:hypothetical protein